MVGPGSLFRALRRRSASFCGRGHLFRDGRSGARAISHAHAGALIMPFWCARLQPGRTGLALHLLQQFGYQAYYPRILNGRGEPEGLFACYCFVGVQVQWTVVQYCPGVAHVLDARRPARPGCGYARRVIRRREGPDGFVLLPCRQPPSRSRRMFGRVIVSVSSTVHYSAVMACALAYRAISASAFCSKRSAP